VKSQHYWDGVFTAIEKAITCHCQLAQDVKLELRGMRYGFIPFEMRPNHGFVKRFGNAPLFPWSDHKYHNEEFKKQFLCELQKQSFVPIEERFFETSFEIRLTPILYIEWEFAPFHVSSSIYRQSNIRRMKEAEQFQLDQAKPNSAFHLWTKDLAQPTEKKKIWSLLHDWFDRDMCDLIVSYLPSTLVREMEIWESKRRAVGYVSQAVIRNMELPNTKITCLHYLNPQMMDSPRDILHSYKGNVNDLWRYSNYMLEHDCLVMQISLDMAVPTSVFSHFGANFTPSPHFTLEDWVIWNGIVSHFHQEALLPIHGVVSNRNVGILFDENVGLVDTSSYYGVSFFHQLSCIRPLYKKMIRFMQQYLIRLPLPEFQFVIESEVVIARFRTWLEPFRTDLPTRFRFLPVSQWKETQCIDLSNVNVRSVAKDRDGALQHSVVPFSLAAVTE
jgi:hypothetical protein